MLTKEELIQLERLVEQEIEIQRKINRNTTYTNAQVLMENRRKDEILKLERLKIKLIDMINEEYGFRPEVSE